MKSAFILLKQILVLQINEVGMMGSPLHACTLVLLCLGLSDGEWLVQYLLVRQVPIESLSVRVIPAGAIWGHVVVGQGVPYTARERVTNMSDPPTVLYCQELLPPNTHRRNISYRTAHKACWWPAICHCHWLPELTTYIFVIYDIFANDFYLKYMRFAIYSTQWG